MLPIFSQLLIFGLILSKRQNPGQFFSYPAKLKFRTCSEHFESLACAVLLSSLVTLRRGADRIYLKEKENVKRGLDIIKDRRNLLNTAVSVLEKCKLSVSYSSFCG